MTLIVRRAKRWDLSALQSAAWWKARFDAATAAQSAAALALWDTNRGIDIYNGSYYIAALAMMYLATGESGYLDYFWTYHNAKVGHAAFCDTLVGTNFTESDKKGWRAETSSGRTLEYQYPLDESISWRHVAWMLAIMKAKDTHINEEPYATYWSDGLAFCEDHIWDKWRSRSITTNIYRNRIHMASHWACIAYYLARVTSSATIKQQCLDIWGDIHHKGMSNYSGYNQAYAAIMDNFHVAATYTDLTRVAPFDWSAQWQSEAGAWNEATTPKQDVGHGVNLYHYLALMGFAKRVPRSKMDRLASAMVRWWDNPGGNWWDFVDATNDSPDAGETGWISDGGGLVSAWAPAILKRMETHTVGQGWNLYASGTLACVLLQTVDPPAVSDPDAAAYIAAVESADGKSLEIGTRQAIQDFVAGCKSDGIWDSIAAAGILSGARTLTGALIPLKGAAPTNVNFVSGDYSRATGLVGNASNKYLNLNRLDTAETLDDAHMSVYITEENTSLAIAYLGADSGSGVTAIGRYSSYGENVQFQNPSPWYPAPAPAVGFLGYNRDSGTIYAIVNGTTSSLVQAATGQAGINYFLFTKNMNGTPQYYTNARLCWYSVGSSIDLSLLKTRLDALFAVIGAIT